MKAIITTPAGLIEAFGGVGAFSKIVGVGQPAVSGFKNRNAIPTRHWRTLVDAAPGVNIEGVTIDALYALHEKQREVA